MGKLAASRDAEERVYKFLNAAKESHKNAIMRYITQRRVSRMKHSLVKDYGIFITTNTEIGENVTFPHPHGIIIGCGAVIGDNCTIYQNVTIGRKNYGGGYPIIGNNCTLFSGAAILGGIKISDGTVIGANSVLMTDTVENGVYVGAPARLVKINK